MSQLTDKPALAVASSERPRPLRIDAGHSESGRLDSARFSTGRLRTVIELGVCLTILVSLFRTFLAGGYMIETGSMAPCLLGYHRPVTCPNCRFRFAVEGNSTTQKAVCPNCGRPEISVAGLLRNDGDHLLVNRGQYEFRRPRRWEVIVFSNPNKPTQAYVKRLVALPGESVHIEGGDVYVGGKILTKDYATQRGMRIPVFDNDFQPAAGTRHWQPRWVIEKPVVEKPGADKPESNAPAADQPAAAQREGGWQSQEHAFHFAPHQKGGRDDKVEWVSYRHWIGQGGFHATSVPLAEWPESIGRPPLRFGALTYDRDAKLLKCEGALSAKHRSQLLAAFEDDESRLAIKRLYHYSHIPITDTYGYNWGRDGQGQHEVRDLMLSAQVRLHDGPGEFVLAITDGAAEFQCVFDVQSQKVRLIDVSTGKELKTGSLNPRMLEGPVSVEISLMDRQVLLAVEGELVFEPYSYAAGDSALPGSKAQGRGPTPRQPVRFGARGADVEVSSLKLYRDVYYTDEVGRRAVDGPLQLKPDEYFVLGDNSPVSKDSRSWSQSTVLTGEMLLGKPLAVHLPSKKRKVQIGGWQTEIRIPEISRIRYIH